MIEVVGLKNGGPRAVRRKAAGLRIDPATAEVFWCYGETMDPYGEDPDLPDNLQSIGRVYFARSPGGDTWVWFGDLPTLTRDALWEREERSSVAAGKPSWTDGTGPS